ncbi:MAG: double-strand break repair helicase AddA [Sphingorhabdus sp.]
MKVEIGIPSLTRSQQAAAVPDSNVWLSASAGSGKTQVLSARVIRLLLDGAKPEEILCLTFTKAAAAEMAARINSKLASWVMMDNDRLFRELEAIGARGGPEERASARRLFAEILDAPGGGLQIMTIHSFCQSLLASFPEEAGIMPGFEALDDRGKIVLQKDVLTQIAHEADESGDLRIVQSLHRLSYQRGEDGAWTFLQRCASAIDAMRGLPEDKGLVLSIRRHLDLGYEGTTEDILQFLVSDENVDLQSIRALIDQNIEWGTKVGSERADTLRSWLASSLPERVSQIEQVHKCWTVQASGEPHALGSNRIPRSEAYVRLATELHFWTAGLVRARSLLLYADKLADALLAGKAFALRYADAKRARGLVDFDDLIEKAAQLLNQGSMTEWVRYKLDRRIDHVLVDEAQDTNDAQWAIIEALTGDFFAGEGAKAGKPRTIFAVGDFKQAIYGFQGTDPRKYRAAGQRYARRLKEQEGQLHELTLAQSFRSTQPILKLVNALLDSSGYSRFGLDQAVDLHIGDKPDVGLIELFEPISAESLSNSDGEDDEEQWLGPEKRELAALLAQKIKALIDERPVLASTKKPLEPRDIMVLFRKRNEVASLLVARLHAMKVPVAGIDRMRLNEQLAVQDLIAAIRFALQPLDDFSLACLLVSPLIGWTQQQLLDHGYRNDRTSLWQHLRSNEAIAADLQPLHTMLASVDFTTPYEFLEQILSGSTEGRRKFIERLGSEVAIPIEEFLNLAIEFEANAGGMLQPFLDWFERGTNEIKRERLTGSNEVQIMTVHGAKGLQAPVVILADAASDPGSAANKDPLAKLPTDNGASIPMLRIDRDARVGQLAQLEEAREKSELNEHYRLLYVAITRAEERLIIVGNLSSRQKEPKTESWYKAIETAMEAAGCRQEYDAKGRLLRVLSGTAQQGTGDKDQAPGSVKSQVNEPLPEWLLTPAASETRPSRPLAPSLLDDSDVGERPPAATMRNAAERGKLIHGLIERIDPNRLDRFESDAAQWLLARDRDLRHDHAAIIAQIRDLLSNSAWSSIFSKASRAEVPIAAVLGETVIAGRLDRLLVEKDYVRIVDFKTTRRVPSNVSDIARSVLRQMAYYKAAVEKIFPDRPVSVALLYTHAPMIVELSATDLEPYEPV